MGFGSSRTQTLLSIKAACTTIMLAGLAVSPSLKASAQTGYTGIYGGGPLYKHVANNITEIQNSGFTEVIVWSVEVNSSGDLNFNGEFPLTSNGAYVGNNTWPNFAADLAAMKQGSAKRITFSIGSSNVGDFQDIQSLVTTQGTGSNSILYKDFQALKQALPSLDAIDFDDENNYDANSTAQFAVMLGNLGYKVTMSPYTNSSYWTSVVSQINSQRAGTVDGIHLQAYAGGAGNSPCVGWNFGSVPVFPGLWDANDTPPQVQAQMRIWATQCGITGGFLWLYDDIAGQTYSGATTAHAYASAINSGVGAGAGGAPQGAYSIYAVYSDGSTFTTGGIDGGGYAYSSNLLGSSVAWNNSTFALGSANNADAWSNTTITLPAGQYSTLNILATGVNGSQASQTFTVNYTDGTSTMISQSLSDWSHPQNYIGESKAVSMKYRNASNGTKDRHTEVHLYGYSFPIVGNKTVQSLTLPTNRNVVVLAYALASDDSASTAQPVDLSSAFNRAGVYTDGATFSCTGGLDNVGYAFSGNLLGPSTLFNNAAFNYGPVNGSDAVCDAGVTIPLASGPYNDVVSAAGQTISLPSGQFSSLRMMATAIEGNQTSQSFKVTYTDGTSTTFTQSLSDWYTPQSYSGELDAVIMSYRDTSSGGQDNRPFNLYNYTFALTHKKAVQSLQLPNNANVEILAMTLVP